MKCLTNKRGFVLYFGVITLLMVLSNSGLAQKTQDLSRVIAELDNGSVKGNVYENKLLGLKIKFPSSMKVESSAEAAQSLKEGVELLRSGVADQKRVDEMIRKERIVLSLATDPSEDPIGASISLTIKKDETKEDIGVMVERTIKFFTEGGKFKLYRPATTVSFGGLNLVTCTLVMDHEGTQIYSQVYSSRRNGYLLTFSIGYVAEKEMAKMEAVLKGIELL